MEFDATPADADEDAAASQRETRRDEALRALYVWHRQWSRIVARVVTRRDWLLSLGLAERRKSTKAASGEGEPK